MQIHRGVGNNSGYSAVEGVQWWSIDPEIAARYGDVTSAELHPKAKVLDLEGHGLHKPKAIKELTEFAKSRDIEFDPEEFQTMSGEEYFGQRGSPHELMDALRGHYDVIHTSNIEGPATMVINQKALLPVGGSAQPDRKPTLKRRDRYTTMPTTTQTQVKHPWEMTSGEFASKKGLEIPARKQGDGTVLLMGQHEPMLRTRNHPSAFDDHGFFYSANIPEHAWDHNSETAPNYEDLFRPEHEGVFVSIRDLDKAIKSRAKDPSHYAMVHNAVKAGHPVPPHVRAEYPTLSNPPPTPEARYTWYRDFLSQAGLTPRPFDEWQALGPREPERYSAQPATHEMTSEQAIEAGIPYHEWHHQVEQAYRYERIPEDHPAWRSLQEAQPDHWGGVPWVGRQVVVHAPHGRFFGTVKQAIPRGVVLEHFDGTLSTQSHDTLQDLQQWADDRTKRGRPIPADVQARLGPPTDEPARYLAGNNRGWLGVDLDGVLARYDDRQGAYHIGEPVPEMVQRVRQWLAEGREVRIFTARVYGPNAEQQRRAIQQWCQQYIGRVLPITNQKDPGMYEFWDDRAIQVARNTGRPVGRFTQEGAPERYADPLPQPGKFDHETPSDPGYAYHATTLDHAEGIHHSGLQTHRPWHGTDQSEWPDRSTERRAYFTPVAAYAHSFTPEGGPPVLLRVPTDRHEFKREGTGDLYTTRPVHPRIIEALDDAGQWRPLRHFFAEPSRLLKQRPDKPERHSMTAAEIDEAVKDWSPPTEAQREAGNYQKPKLQWHGLTITIENPRGTKRREEWSPLAHHYGYLNRSEGRDGEHVDAYMGPHPESEIVFVVDQEHPGGRFDEHKVCLGFRNGTEARQGYLDNYPSGWHCGPVTAMTLDQFRAWLQHGDTKARVADQVSRYTAEGTPEQYGRHRDQTGQRTLHFESAAPTGARKWTAEQEAQHPRDETGEFTEKDAPAAEPKPKERKPAAHEEQLEQHVANLHDAMQEQLGRGRQFLARHDGRPLWIPSADHLRISPDRQTIEHTDPQGRWVRADLAQLDHWAERSNLQPFTGPEGILTTKENPDARPTPPGGRDRTSDRATPAAPDQRADDRPLGGDERAGPGAGPGVRESGASKGACPAERLTGGRADHRPDSDFDPRALAKGIKHEAEHTDNLKIAKEIAKDHLEDPSYYDKLDLVESSTLNQLKGVTNEQDQQIQQEGELSRVPGLAGNERQVSESSQRGLSELRRTGNSSASDMEGLVRSVSAGHGAVSRGLDFGQDQQQRKLRTDQLQVGNARDTGEQQANESKDHAGRQGKDSEPVGKGIEHRPRNGDRPISTRRDNNQRHVEPTSGSESQLDTVDLNRKDQQRTPEPSRRGDKTNRSVGNPDGNESGYVNGETQKWTKPEGSTDQASRMVTTSQERAMSQGTATVTNLDQPATEEATDAPDPAPAAADQETDRSGETRPGTPRAGVHDRGVPAGEPDQVDGPGSAGAGRGAPASGSPETREEEPASPPEQPAGLAGINQPHRPPDPEAPEADDSEPPEDLKVKWRERLKGLPTFTVRQLADDEMRRVPELKRKRHAAPDRHTAQQATNELMQYRAYLAVQRERIAGPAVQGDLRTFAKELYTAYLTQLDRYSAQGPQLTAAQQERAARRQEAERLREQATQLAREVVNKRNNQWSDQDNQRYDDMMRRADTLEKQIKDELPALARTPHHMTTEEFIDYHRTGSISPDAYRHGAGIEHHDIKDHPELLHSFRDRTGRTVELRRTGKPIQYVDHDETGEILRDEKGLARYMPPERVKARGLPTHDTTVTAFANGKPLGYASDEWGADGVFVHPDEHGKGIGTTLLTHFRRQFPAERKIGQMTPAGEAMARSYHRGLTPAVEQTPDQRPTP